MLVTSRRLGGQRSGPRCTGSQAPRLARRRRRARRLRARDRRRSSSLVLAPARGRLAAPGSSIVRGMRAKGLIAAGGEATRLGELTRVVNKHLLPVGDWPMIYYPLQLLQLAGVEEVMIVTGQGHAGQVIDLLGNGRMQPARHERAALRPRSDLQGAGRGRRDRAGRRDGGELRRRRRSRRLPGRQHLRVRGGGGDPRASSTATTARRCSSRRCPTRSASASSSTATAARVVDVVEKAGVVDLRYDAPPSSDAVVGLYCYSPDVFDLIRGLEPSSRGELEITDVNRHYAENGTLACHRVTRLVGGRRHAGVAAPRSAR